MTPAIRRSRVSHRRCPINSVQCDQLTGLELACGLEAHTVARSVAQSPMHLSLHSKSKCSSVPVFPWRVARSPGCRFLLDLSNLRRDIGEA